MSNHSMSLEKPDGWIVKNTFGAVELFLHHERAVDAFNAWGSFIGPVYQHAPQPVAVAQTPIETCPACMGSGYSNHPDSGETCFACKGQGVASPAQSSWQPIETAPKDGTNILVTMAGGTDGPYYVLFWNDNFFESLESGEGPNMGHLTHWQPLQMPPASPLSSTDRIGEFVADYSPLSAQDIAKEDPELTKLHARSRPVSSTEGK